MRHAAPVPVNAKPSLLQAEGAEFHGGTQLRLVATKEPFGGTNQDSHHQISPCGVGTPERPLDESGHISVALALAM